MALKHSTSTLTPISALYLVLLAMQYSIMPRISKKYVDKRTNKESLAVVEEGVKMAMGVAGFLLTDNQKVLTLTKNWTLSSSLLAAGIPSALYAIQGVLTHTAYQNLDSVTFNGLTQVKTLSAAICCYFLLGKAQSKMQILALIFLFSSTLIFQGTAGRFLKSLRTGSMRARSKADFQTHYLLGIIPCLGATILSGLAGALSQRSLQIVGGPNERNAFFYSAEISFFSAVCLIASSVSRRLSLNKENKTLLEKGNGKHRSGYFDYWSGATFIPIFVKALGGILTALVHKNSGSVMKGFALVLGLIFSGLIQAVIDNETLSSNQIFATSLVLLSSWLHFTNPLIVNTMN